MFILKGEVRMLCENTTDNTANFPLLKRNFSWILLGNIIYGISKGLIMIIIAKLGSPKMVGQLALAFAIVAPVFMLASLRLRAILATDAKHEYNFSYYILLRLITSITAVLVICFIVTISGYTGEFALVIIFIGIGRGIESMSDIVYGLFENEEKMDIIGRSMVIKSVLSILFMGFFFKSTGSLSAGAAGLAIAWLIVFLLYDFIKARRYINFKISYKPYIFSKLFKTCIPLSVFSGIGSIEINLSNYLVQGYLGSTILGYYSSILNLIAVGDIIIGSLGSATIPRLAKYYAEGDKKSFIKITMQLMVLCLAIGAIGFVLIALFGRTLLVLLFDPSYGQYLNIFLLVMISSCLRYLANCLNNSLTAARKLNIQPIISIATIVSTIIFSMLLVPLRGIEGVAYTAIISSCVYFLGNLIMNVITLK